MIELKNVSGGYGRKPVVRDISLTFPDGKITALIGPNGCGKSTLLKLCCKALRHMEGEVLLDGNPLSSLLPKDIAQKVALLPQSRTVPDITVGSLVLHGRFPWLGHPRVYQAEDKAIAKKAMEQAGILDKRNTLLNQLSGGERQKVYLAMLLAQDTCNVVMDEPTTYLDIGRQLELYELMKTLKKEGKCVTAVLHDLETALEIADLIAVMKDGRLLAAGSPEKILASGALEKAFEVRIEHSTRIKFEPL